MLTSTMWRRTVPERREPTTVASRVMLSSVLLASSLATARVPRMDVRRVQQRRVTIALQVLLLLRLEMNSGSSAYVASTAQVARRTSNRALLKKGGTALLDSCQRPVAIPCLAFSVTQATTALAALTAPWPAPQRQDISVLPGLLPMHLHWQTEKLAEDVLRQCSVLAALRSQR